MTTITVDYVVAPGQMDAVLAALAEMQEIIAREEPGCLGYQVLRPADPGTDPDGDPGNRLLLIETYRDAQALADHGETAHFKAIVEARVLPRLESRSRRSCRNEIDWRRG